MMAPSKQSDVSRNDTPINDFFSTRFMKKEFTTDTTLRLHKLTNQVHRCFDIHAFHEHDGFRPDYQILEQSCRLATCLLTCGACDLHLKQIILPLKTHSRIDPNDNKKQVLEDDLVLQTLAPWEKDMINKYVLYTSYLVHFDISTDLQAGATTEQIGSNDIILPECPNGFKSIIHISRSAYDALAQATADPDDVPRLLTLRFEFAVMLVHELMHAIHNLLRGRLDHEPFLGPDVRTAERGYEVEAALFGGHLRRMFAEGDPDDKYSVVHHVHEGKKSRLVGLPVLWEYPYHGLLEEYELMGLDWPVRRVPEEEESKLDVAWRVPVTFPQRFFQDGF